MLKVPSRRRTDPGGPELERQRFHRRQLLASRDLGDLIADTDERRYWHNRAVHDAYGVAEGLRLGWDDRQLPIVLPGLAFDCYGRELEVLEPIAVAPPAGLDPEGDDEKERELEWALLLRFQEDGANGCGCHGHRPGTAELVWHRGRGLGVDDGVVISRGRWVVDGDPIYLPREGFRPPAARAYTRPLLGSGATVAGGTDWQSWQQAVGFLMLTGDGNVGTLARGIEVTVDTRAAGFTRTPCYFASLQGGPWQNVYRFAVTTPIERITATARDRFTYSLWDVDASQTGFLDPGTPAAEERLQRFLDLARGRLYVSWLGIEELPEIPDSLKTSFSSTGTTKR